MCRISVIRATAAYKLTEFVILEFDLPSLRRYIETVPNVKNMKTISTCDLIFTYDY